MLATQTMMTCMAHRNLPDAVDDGGQEVAAGGWPAWATEEVAIVASADGWISRGRAEADDVTHILGALLTAGPEHVGSTAVRGLAAKPIIDLMAGVASLDDAESATPLLAPHGWHLVPPDLDERPWRRFFVKVADGRRRTHLHLMRTGTARWTEQIAFRDALIADATLRAEYAALKHTLSETFRDDREAYTNAKAAFIQRVLDVHPQ
jgi:GrpB-like predicted nucleotidyltransferase (UPF0157 family)